MTHSDGAVVSILCGLPLMSWPLTNKGLVLGIEGREHSPAKAAQNLKTKKVRKGDG